MSFVGVGGVPQSIAQEELTDADRVYPGNGDAPLSMIFQTLQSIGFRGALSLELFNRTYWEMPAEECAKVGLEKMKAAVAKAGLA